MKELRAYIDKFVGSLPSKLEVKDRKNKPPLWTYTMWPGNATLPRSISSYSLEDYYRQIGVPRFDLGKSLYSSILVGNKTYDLNTTLSILTNTYKYSSFSGLATSNMFAIGRDILSSSDIAEIGKCLPSNGYTWGFSSLMLFTFCMLTIVIGMFLIALHIDAYCNSSADRYKLYISPYRDVLDLAAELRAHYGATEAENMPAKALDEAMREDPAVAGLDTELLHARRMAKWWQQSNGSSRVPTWYNLRKRSTAVRSDPVDAEESLMSIGVDAQGAEIEMGKVPAKAVTRGSSSSST